MSLAPGTQLGRYEVLAMLGAGGMGEVYLARDPQLDRQVAIKVLPADVAGDHARLQRFMQEARAASALNHPNILTVHEIGEADSTSFIVTEFIDGVTLRQRLAGKRLKIGEVLEIASQVANALSRAHQAGIVHRDIKPENIMIRSDGIVKVLDFGLAKLVEAPSTTDASTRVAIGTTPGVVMGTTRYMSPEQVRGLDLDARTDIFSLGIVIYQMAAGHAPFDGATTSDVIAAIIHHEPPPLAQLSADVPHELERIVTKALAKDPDERYQVVKDLLLDLKALQRERLTDTSTSTARQAPPGVKRGGRLIGWIGAAIVVVAVLVAVFFFSGRGASALTERDTIVLADFVNSTGDPVFDGTLKQGLAVQLGQSPYLNIYSDDRVREALRFMGRSPDDRVTRDVAREICQRQGLKALLAGTIAGLGTHYVVTLEAVNAQTGDTIAREQVEAESKEQVLRKLGDAASMLRNRLGESLASIEKFDAPIEAATTSSLEALKAFAIGDEHRARGTYQEAIPFYKRALELDPNFAIAYARLAVMYNNTRQPDLAAEYAARAFERRERVSERERFYIESRYYGDVLGNVEKTIEVLELWKQTYPRDFVPYNNLAAVLLQLGQFDRVIPPAREAARLNPNAASTSTNLAAALIGLGRFAEATAAIEQAVAEKRDSTTLHLQLYLLGFLQGDAAAMQQQVSWAKGKSSEYLMVKQQAEASAAHGRLRESRAFSTRALELTTPNLGEVTAFLQASGALTDAALDECAGVKAATTTALGVKRPRTAVSPSAVALALCADVSAETLADELTRRLPDDTVVNSLAAPLIRGLIEIHRNNPAHAIQLLEAGRKYDAGGFGSWIVYVRGLAYLRLRDGVSAAAEFRRMLEHKSAITLGPVPALYLIPLAELGLARALALSGDVPASRKAYEELLASWKDADPDLALLQKARDEYQKLK
jgi:tetratricopeptide (TPR) repeat protein